MFEKIKIELPDNSVISGFADTKNISAAEITALHGTWISAPGTICKAGSSTVAYIHNEKFIKCSPARKFLRALRKIFQTPRPIRSMRMAEELKNLNIPTPQVFCAVREKSFGIPVCDYLVTGILDPAKFSFIDKCGDLPQHKRTAIFNACALLLQKMHQNRICHGDASLRNFYYSPNDSVPSPGVIDLDACRKIPLWAGNSSFIKEDARFISSFIICAKLNEAPEMVDKICRYFLSVCQNSNHTKRSAVLRVLIKETRRYLVRTRR